MKPLSLIAAAVIGLSSPLVGIACLHRDLPTGKGGISAELFPAGQCVPCRVEAAFINQRKNQRP